MAIIYGDEFDNELFGTSDADDIGGKEGSDIILGGNGRDDISGHKGDDWIDGGDGDDLLSGNLGDDTFYFDGSGGDDIVLDFEDGDTIAFDAALGLSFSEILIGSENGNAVINWGSTSSITLEGVSANSLTASDFDFGASTPMAHAREPLAAPLASEPQSFEDLSAIFAVDAAMVA